MDFERNKSSFSAGVFKAWLPEAMSPALLYKEAGPSKGQMGAEEIWAVSGT